MSEEPPHASIDVSINSKDGSDKSIDQDVRVSGVKMSEELKMCIDQVEKLLREKRYEEALKQLDRAVEIDVDQESSQVWRLMALTRYERWKYSCLHQVEYLPLCALTNGLRNESPLEGYLKDTYNVYVVAMAYPENKHDPDMLLTLAHLYSELRSYKGTLTLCSLLLDSYASYARLNEALFLAGVAAKALKMHQEAAEYFSFVLEDPPFRLRPYVLMLLAAREYEALPSQRERARETYLEAYRLMITRKPETQSEKRASELSLSKKSGNENQRLQAWHSDPNTWEDIACMMYEINFPILVIDCFTQAQSCGGLVSTEPCLMLAMSYIRLHYLANAQQTLEKSMAFTRYHWVVRYYLARLSRPWKERFELEQEQCVMIQKHTRGFFGRKIANKKRAVKLLALQNHSALVIQCRFRQFMAYKKLVLLRHLQRLKEAAEMERMDLEDTLPMIKCCTRKAIVLQGFYKIIVAKNVKLFLRQKKHRIHEFASMALGKNQHRMLQYYFARLPLFVLMCRETKDNAARIIQAIIRGFLARRWAARARDKADLSRILLLRAISRLKSKHKLECFREWLEWTAMQKELKQRSAVTIQCFFRGILAKRKVQATLAKHIRMHSFMRQMIMKREQHMAFLCYQAWKRYRIQQRHAKYEAATIIQKHIRGVLTRQRVRRIRSRMKKHEKLIANFQRDQIRKYMEKCFEEWVLYMQMDHVRRNVNATTIQRHVRGRQARKRFQIKKDVHLLYESERTRLSSLPTQHVKKRLIFRAIVSFRYAVQVEQHKSAVLIQKIHRGCMARQRFRVLQRKHKLKQVTLERLNRTFFRVARAFFQWFNNLNQQRKDKRNQAARIIQRMLRTHQLRRRLRVSLAYQREMGDTVDKIQNQKKYARLRSIFTALRVNVHLVQTLRSEAACCIQREVRRWSAIRRSRKQAAQRAFQARMLDAAAMKPVQYYFRKWEETMIQKSVFKVTLAAQSNLSSSLILNMAQNIKAHSNVKASPERPVRQRQSGTEERGGGGEEGGEGKLEVSSMQFYAVLSKVKQTGVCHLPSSRDVDGRHLRDLLSFSTSVITDCRNKDLNLSNDIIETISGFDTCPVQKIVLYHAQIDLCNLVKLSDCLNKTTCNILSLVLGSSVLGNGGATTLAAGIAYSRCKLQQLVLDRCSIGNAGGCALAEALLTNKSLWKLDLSGNHLSDRSSKQIGNMLVSNTTLKVLNLDGNAVRDTGLLCYLAPAIGALPEMTSLEIISIRPQNPFSEHSKEVMGENYLRLKQSWKRKRSILIDLGWGTQFGENSFG